MSSVIKLKSQLIFSKEARVVIKLARSLALFPLLSRVQSSFLVWAHFPNSGWLSSLGGAWLHNAMESEEKDQVHAQSNGLDEPVDSSVLASTPAFVE